MSVLKKCPFCGNRAIIFPRDLIKERNIINEMEESFNNVFYSIECEHCGVVIDRDLNASLNLSMYKLA